MQCSSMLRHGIECSNKKVSDAMIATVICLAIMDVSVAGFLYCYKINPSQAHILTQAQLVFSRNREKYQHHAKGLWTMIKLRGGFDSLEWFLEEVIQW